MEEYIRIKIVYWQDVPSSQFNLFFYNQLLPITCASDTSIRLAEMNQLLERSVIIIMDAFCL